MMTGTKFNIKKLDGKNDFGLWQDTLKLEDVLTTLNSRELQKMTKAKGDGDEGLYVRGRSVEGDMEQGTYSAPSKSQERSSRLRCYICQSDEHLKRDCPRECHIWGTAVINVELSLVLSELGPSSPT
nr:zinc finger, CCHC-type [Tanacetum cinerariifolium]